MTRAVAVKPFKHKRAPSREAPVLAACLQVLKLAGIFHWRNNSGMAMLPGRGGKPMPVRFGAPGSPDIIGILPGGRFLGVECKPPLGPRGGGKHQTPEQVEFQRAVLDAGGLYLLCRCGDDLASVFRDMRIKKRDGGGFEIVAIGGAG